ASRLLPSGDINPRTRAVAVSPGSREAGPQFTHLHRCPLRSWTFARDLEGLLTCVAGEQEESAHDLLDLGERAIGNHHGVASHFDPSVRRARFERLTHGEQTSPLEILAETHHAAVDLAAFRICARSSLSDWLHHQKRIRHGVPSWLVT